MAKTSKHLEIQARHIYKPEIKVCPYCGENLEDRLHYQWRKTVQQLDGPVYVASRAKECANPECGHQGKPHFSAAAQMVTVPECTYGLDVIAQIGWWRDRERLNREQIHSRLKEHGVQLCEREVDHLYAQYQILVGCSSRLDEQELAEIVKKRGGLRISATVSDKQGSVRKALEEMWPDVPHQWCQSHYLGNSTRPIYDQDSALKTEMRKTIRNWYDALDETLPQYQSPFEQVSRTLDWVDGIKKVLDAPLPTDDDPGPGGDEVARRLAHYLGQPAELSDLSPWQAEFRQDLFDRSERYWSGLFHCYDVVGLPPTNNDLESLYGQTKRQLRRQLGGSELCEPLLRRGAWAVLQIDVDAPTELRERLAQVSWKDYAAERARYQRRQEQFRCRYRWRHHRDSVLDQRFVAWAKAVPDC